MKFLVDHFPAHHSHPCLAMLHPRHFTSSCLRRQFLSSPSLYLQQIRTKTVKHLYKGGQPKQAKKPAPVVPAQKQAKIKPETEKNAIPPKKAKDPLQGMREAAEREKSLRNSPPTPTSTKDAPGAVGGSTPTTNPTETGGKQLFAEPLIHPSPGATGASPSPSPVPPRTPEGGNRWMFYMVAAIFGVGGVYLFMSSPKPSVIHPNPNVVTSLQPVAKNVEEAIGILKEV